MAISIRTATGTGRTPLSAFDDALHNAGVADLNLITLSSVIPPHSTLTLETDPRPARLESGHGDKLYCVLSAAHAELRGEAAWAGLGWVFEPGSGGLFVEHHSGSEESLTQLIDLTLTDMAERRARSYGPVQQVHASVHCDDLPVCALVVAAYEVEPWGPRRG